MKNLTEKVIGNWKVYLLLILIVNFILRLVIFYSTSLFSFSDYQVYLNAIEIIHEDGKIPLLRGNYLYTISYMGYFAKYVLGNLDYFFLFNCALGTLTTYLISLLTIKMTRRVSAGLIAALILTVYTEFMVFSSVFYTPIIMLFLLSCFLLLLFWFITSVTVRGEAGFLALLSIVYMLTFLFKPELLLLPFFLIAILVFIYKQKALFRKTIMLILSFSVCLFFVYISGIYDKKDNEVIVNDFIFFGHTDYGGDGGEGAFIYAENRVRYEEAWGKYLVANNISYPTLREKNNFQFLEIKNFIIHHPEKWVALQLEKFFRTFGIVPETTSFKILYTGLFNQKLWITSILIVAPVILIMLLFLFLFQPKVLNLSGFRKPNKENVYQTDEGFRYPFLTICLYYFFISIFLGQYQERYRLPLMVGFIVPLLASFLINLTNKFPHEKKSTIWKSIAILTFIMAWTFQINETITKKQRFITAIEKLHAIDNHNTF